MDTLRKKPPTFGGDITRLAAALSPLCELSNWVVWKWMTNGNGKWTKPPFQSRYSSDNARNNAPATWSSLADAVEAVKNGTADGIGFVLTDTDIAAIDLDHCRDPLTGEVDPWAQGVIDMAAGAYVEITVSGTGVRVIGRGTGNKIHKNYKVEGREGARIEFYRRAVRFITVSGLEISHCAALPNIDALIDDLVTQHEEKPLSIASQNSFEFGARGINNLIRNGVPEGHRSEAFQSVVFRAAKAGLSIDDIEEVLTKYPNGIARKYENRLRPEIERSYSKMVASAGMYQARGLSASPRDHAPPGEATYDWEEPDWSILDDRRGELPPFPIETLPEVCRDWVERAAHGAGATTGHIVVPMLGIISSLIGTARRVKASRSWTEPTTCWTAVVGFSGTSKTPGINATKRALSQVERDRKPKIAEQQRAHESRVEAAKANRALWKKEVEKLAEQKVVSLNQYRNTVASEPTMPVEAVDPGPFVAPRLYVSDSTIERLAVLLQARPQGMLMLSDELASLFLNMSRYSGGQDNEFWLEAWNGGSYTVERMGRPPIVVDYLLVGVVGGLQPDKLARSFKGDHDGMYSRVLFAWPPEPGYRPLTNDVTEIEPEIINAITRILALDGGRGADGEFAPRSVPLSTQAIETFEQFRQFVHAGKHSLDGREREWWSKAPAHVLRLAGTLSYLYWAMSEGEEPNFIEECFLSAAVKLVRDYFWPHSRAALRQIGLSERHANARRVLRWIAAQNLAEVSIRGVRRDALAQSLDAEQTRDLLENLEKAGWLRKKTTKTTGRARHRWQVNPKLFTIRDAESAESAENRERNE
jgi:hypothetical protein